jgi:cystathionine beta-lyase
MIGAHPERLDATLCDSHGREKMTATSNSPVEPFELSVEALRARRSNKWTKFPADVLPAWVADMDFAVPLPVQRSIARLVEQRDYGYAARVGDDSLETAFAERMERRFGWSLDPALVQPVSELIQGMFATVLAYSDSGDGVVVQTPIYPPFLRTVEETGRRLVDNPLADDGTRFVPDIPGLREKIDARTRVLLFCNPHNPTGRVFEREELLAVGELAVERDLVIVADEIHADLVYPGHQHIPMATLSPEIAARTVTLTSATKGFNIPGLRCALMHFGSTELRERFRKTIPDRLLGQVAVPGIDATIAAWREGQDWLDAVMARLLANRDRLGRFLAAELPEIRHHTPEGTYLAWLDCRALNLTSSPFEFFLDRAKVGFSDGAEFGPQGRSCVRLNFATSASILEDVLERMATAVRATRRARAG